MSSLCCHVKSKRTVDWGLRIEIEVKNRTKTVLLDSFYDFIDRHATICTGRPDSIRMPSD